VRLRDLFADPRMAGVDVDSHEYLQVRRQIFAAKPLLRGVLRDFADVCAGLDERHFSGEGLRVEIGAGASPFKADHPDVITTDVLPSPGLDMVVDALAMPFEDGSVRAVYGINCFHHFADPDAFFRELQRVLVPGGGCVLIDPYDGPFARWLYPRLFRTEGYDLDQADWTLRGADADEAHVMHGANQALSHVVFVRDKAIFERRYPGLVLVGRRPVRNYPRYLLSGGFNFRQLVPFALDRPLRALERAIAPLGRIFAIHHVIVVRKAPSSRAS
jgi:SAM-dependent methyltransferase